MEDLGETAQGKPGSASSAVWVAVVEGRAISPDVLPFCWHTAQTGKGYGGWGHVFLEELGIGSMVPKSVWSGKEGLWGVKQVDAT